MMWNSSWYFILTIILPCIVIATVTLCLLLRVPKSQALIFPSVQNLKNIRPSWRVRGYRMLPWLRFTALCCLIAALARPQQGNALTKITSEGISIMMVIDTSGSMKALDFDDGPSRKNRLDVVKEVFADFVVGKDGMLGRSNDLIGLVAFAGYPESKCPLTLDHSALLSLLDQTSIPEPIYDQRGEILNEDEMQTAIGDALAIALERLKNHPAKSKVLLLLSDGESNAGIVEPLEVAGEAKDLGVKIYTIGVGSNGMAPFPVKNIYGEQTIKSVPVRLDEETLKKIAEIGQGKYFNARNREMLKNIYQEIDQLERQKIEFSYLEYQEVYPFFVLLAIMLLLGEKILVHTILRKVP